MRAERIDRPAPTVTAGHDWIANQVERQEIAADMSRLEEPAPCITTRAYDQGRNAARPSQRQRGAVRLDVEQCALLQAFPAGLPWPANKRAAHRLIGNAVPPKLGEVVGRAVREALEGAPVSADAGLSRRADE